MVTYNLDMIPTSKINSVCNGRTITSKSSSQLQLLNDDGVDATSSIPRNSIYKFKIDLLFDNKRLVRDNRFDDPHGSHRTRSIIMYGRSELANSNSEKSRSKSNFARDISEASKNLSSDATKKNVLRITNSVQQQIEKLFTDIAKDATSCFIVTYLGSLPLREKVSSLQGLQKPLKELYLKEVFPEQLNTGSIDICEKGLRIRISQKLQYQNGVKDQTIPQNNLEIMTPFHNIAVWSAVKFVVSENKDGAAFLPLITDPDSTDKSSLFQPLNDNEKNRLMRGPHAPVFAVVMRSTTTPRILECHGFICKNTEEAIVIAATLYQSLMIHVSTNTQSNTNKGNPRNENGVSCVSIASSSAMTDLNYKSPSQVISIEHGSSLSSSNGQVSEGAVILHSVRKKRDLCNERNFIEKSFSKATVAPNEERKCKSNKTRKVIRTNSTINSEVFPRNDNIAKSGSKESLSNIRKNSQAPSNSFHKEAEIINKGIAALTLASTVLPSGSRADVNGDIFTRVAIPRSGSFLNTGGLTRYKSKATRRPSAKLGGGGGSPLGFSELFNEFRVHENLHSLDDILYAIIDPDGMSFNDLKPIYKEFLLKLAVTLTKDELFHRSKNIMRRQRKKKYKQKITANASKKRSKILIFKAKSLREVFHLGHFNPCSGKEPKSPRNKEIDHKPTRLEDKKSQMTFHQNEQRNRVATSGSDVSVVQNENLMRGFHRNSSSGYVSCSECSYDSEACTCISADRCYCSLRNEHSKTNLSNKSLRFQQSLKSCRSNEKCYCSLSPDSKEGNELSDINSDTTWCDTDSCASASKCYCKQTKYRIQSSHKPSEKLALDYELFKIRGNCQSVEPDEALSVKKSVEAAAVFADVKLAQTTDIKSLRAHSSPGKHNLHTVKRETKAQSCTSSRTSTQKRRESLITETGFKIKGKSLQQKNSDDLFSKSKVFEANPIKSQLFDNVLKNGNVLLNKEVKSLRCNEKSVQIVGASLEHTLGYLP